MTFRLLDQWRSHGPTLILDNVEKRVVAVGEFGQPDPLPGIAHGFPVAARFDSSPDRVVVHAEDAHESAVLYTVHRGAEDGLWSTPQLLSLPAGCVPLDLRRVSEGGIVARHHAGAGGTDICWYDGKTGDLRVLQRESGWIYCAALSPDRRFVAFLVGGPVSLSATLWLSDVRGDAPARRLHPPDGYAALGAPSWTADGTGLVFCSTYKRDFAAVLLLDLASGSCRELAASNHDLDVRVPADDDRLLIIENRDGATSMSLLSPASSTPPAPLALPGLGVASVLRRPSLGPGDELLITFTAPGLPSGVWAVSSGRDPRPYLPTSRTHTMTRPERLHVTAADSVRVPLFDWYPSRDDTDETLMPVVVALHGGPEEQWLLRHEPLFELIHQRGVAVLAADLRGSLGFGMTYSSLDDGVLNFDVLLDLAAVHAALSERGMDPRRAILLGTSFGAYQVLLALAHQPDLWAAGIAVSGVSDPLSYLSQTQPHRRAQRELAYGSAERDAARLAEMSPLAGAARITSPLLLTHGAGDVRVPVSQSRQLASAVCAAGGQVVLREFPQEGHRFGDPANKAALNQLIVDFVLTNMQGKLYETSSELTR